MIRARKGGPLGAVLDRYIGWKFRRAFRGLWVRGALPTGAEPRLVYANHCSWWDGFVAHQLCQVMGWDGYALMEEQNLERYRLLARLGAFSIRPKESASSLESLRYARQLLAKPRAAVVVFPEGELRPFASGPLRLQGGISLLARSAKVKALPLAVRYAFFEHELPDVLVEVGEEHAPGPLAVYERALGEAVERVGRATSLAGFERLVQGKRGVAERWDAVRGRREG